MDHIAEEGVASHWLYKDDDATLNDLQKRTHQWLQSLLDIQSQTGDSGEFLEHVKVDLFPDAVYVFTPNGKILSLPRGASPVDFAYASPPMSATPLWPARSTANSLSCVPSFAVVTRGSVDWESRVEGKSVVE